MSCSKSIPGIGVTLAMTIMYETGSIDRFADAGHFCSYCRCVPSKHLSNGKVKGSGNVRNGNPYLSWAYAEAAHFAIRFDPIAKRFYERKRARTNAARRTSDDLAQARSCLVPYHARPGAVPVCASIWLIQVGDREPSTGAGVNPSWLIGPCLPPFSVLLWGCAQVVSHMVLAPHFWEQPRWLSSRLDTPWNRRFSGGTSTVPGVLGAGDGCKHLDPDGWLVRIPAPEAQRDYGRAPRQRNQPCRCSLPGQPGTPGRERCGSLTRAF